MPVRAYCGAYSDYSKHPNKGHLDRIANDLNLAIRKVNELGYKLDELESCNLRKALRVAVQIRNKHAHGNLEPPLLSGIEPLLLRAFKGIINLIPFSEFVFYGAYASKVYEFVERPPKLKTRKRDSYFWVESRLFKAGYSDNVPFLSYNEGPRTIYFLNDRPKNGIAEYIEYESGQIRYYDVDLEWSLEDVNSARLLRPRSLAVHMDVLSRFKPEWKRILLTKDGVEATSNSDVGVYIFTNNVALGSRSNDVVLYVGKTTDLKCRLEHYLRIQKGFDRSRPELTRMFAQYAQDIRIMFAPLPKSGIGLVERAVYETTMPEYNLRAPPEE